ncbi:hypothetical protein Trydic_g11690 [Trypoxylus dichotomus]
MSKRIILLWCLSCVLNVQCIYIDNTTDFSRCQMHVSRSETEYTIFYEIDKYNQFRSNWYQFDFHFSVLAPSNAHILISETNKVADRDAVYEIVLGAGANTFSDIRRLIRGQTKHQVKTANILSSIDYTAFWIRVWTDGLVEVGYEGDNATFLQYKDPQPLKVKYFSFSTWNKVNARWVFDCKERGSGINSNDETLLTSAERLERDLLKNYSIFVRPVLDESDMTDVLLHLTPQYVSLNEKASKLIVKGTGNMRWTDEKLNWDPNDYDGKKSIKLASEDIWTPDLRLFDQRMNLQDVFIYDNGSVFANILVDTTTWCSIEGLDAWPSDVHNCSLYFSFGIDGEKIRLLYLSQSEDFFKQPTALASEWIVTNTDINYKSPFENEYLDEIQGGSPGVSLSLTLKRLSSVYKLIFLSPFFVISVCCLSTFWTSPHGSQKISLGCIQLLIESIILICISTILPGHSTKVPTLISLYSECLIYTTASIIISIVVINISRNEHGRPVSRYFEVLLLSNWLQRSLFLPQLNNNDQHGIRLLNRPTSQDMWLIFGMVIDRIMFIVYLVLFILAISSKSV